MVVAPWLPDPVRRLVAPGSLMLFLGIDPGFGRCGYGLVREERTGAITWQAQGVIETPKTDTFAMRLQQLRDELRALLLLWQPDEVAVEELFFATNAKTAISVGHARGVILLTLADARMKINEYTPLQVKQAISGYGAADKKQMQEMVRILLNLKTIPKPDDAADALAIAITHVQSRRMRNLAEK